MVPGEMAAVGRHRRLADSDDSDEETTATKVVLTTARASELCPKAYRLIGRHGGFTSMEDMSALSALDYVDLTGNSLESVQGLATNTRLKTLILKNNKLSDVEHVLKTATLQVLDISDNEFVTTEWLPRAAFAASLVALMVRGNKLVALEGLACLRRIQTLIISDNQIEDISAVTQLPSLTKLSASKNCIRVIPDAIANLLNLREFRLAHNRLAALPSKETLARLSSLKIFDIGHNRIASLEHLSACGDTLIQLNAAGNPACSVGENFRNYLQTLCPKLEVIEGHRVSGGRRKLRVNRQRLQAGLPLEPERKFARPPSAYYLQKEKGGKQGALVTEQQPRESWETGKLNDLEKSSKKRKSRPWAEPGVPDTSEGRTEKAQLNNPEEEDDGALDANWFVEMAKAKSIPTLNGPSKDSSLHKAERKGSESKRKRIAELKKHDFEFGSGGASKW